MAKAKGALPYKYPGWLGRTSSSASLNKAARNAARKFVSANPEWTDEEFDAAYQAGLDEAMQQRGYEVLFGLLEHFHIDPNDKLWGPKLAWKLAAAHVPASQFTEHARRGRPPATRNRFLALLSRGQAGNLRSRVGRPTRWGEVEYRKLDKLVTRGSKLLRAAGKRPSNRGALEAAYMELRASRPELGLTVAECRARAERDARRVSEARKFLRKFR